MFLLTVLQEKLVIFAGIVDHSTNLR